MKALPADFLAHVAKQEDGCWLFVGGTVSEGGYRKGAFGPGVERWAHRRAYELAYGPVPAGLHVDHLCFVRPCVNPAHLEAVTPRVNAQRALARRVPKHGVTRYDAGCRCDECRGAKKAYIERVRTEVAFGIRPIVHGSATARGLYGCRCEACRRSGADRMMRSRRARGVKPKPQPQHGGFTMYTNYGCRCDLCRDNWNTYWRERRRAAKRAAAPQMRAS